jgi:hypothetical protein
MFSRSPFLKLFKLLDVRHDIQHDDIQLKDTQHKDTQHIDIQHDNK